MTEVRRRGGADVTSEDRSVSVHNVRNCLSGRSLQYVP